MYLVLKMCEFLEFFLIFLFSLFICSPGPYYPTPPQGGKGRINYIFLHWFLPWVYRSSVLSGRWPLWSPNCWESSACTRRLSGNDGSRTDKSKVRGSEFNENTKGRVRIHLGPWIRILDYISTFKRLFEIKLVVLLSWIRIRIRIDQILWIRIRIRSGM